jgi:hypothetical protein
LAAVSTGIAESSRRERGPRPGRVVRGNSVARAGRRSTALAFTPSLAHASAPLPFPGMARLERFGRGRRRPAPELPNPNRRVEAVIQWTGHLPLPASFPSTFPKPSFRLTHARARREGGGPWESGVGGGASDAAVGLVNEVLIVQRTHGTCTRLMNRIRGMASHAHRPYPTVPIPLRVPRDPAADFSEFYRHPQSVVDRLEHS